jgi:hypothetical protein
MRRRPLLRAAAVGGSAYVAGRRHAQPATPPPGSTAPSGLSSQDIAALKELSQLREQGILTDAEFEEQKQRLLAGT